MTDTTTLPQGVPSNKELFELVHTWDNYLGTLKETLYSEFREIRDRTLAAKDVNILDLNRIIGNRQDRISELEVELNIANTAAIEWRNKVTEKILYVQHLETELKSVREKTLRCEMCDWPYAFDASKGCVPGNCSYRPEANSPEWYRIEARKKELRRAADEAEKDIHTGPISQEKEGTKT